VTQISKTTRDSRKRVEQLVEDAFLVLPVVAARLIRRSVIARNLMLVSGAPVGAVGEVGAASKQPAEWR